MKLSDFKWLFHSDTLTLQHSENPFWDYWVFDFKSWDNKWKPGQHWIFKINSDFKGSKMRPLSVASIPEEWIIKLATKISDQPSEYKKYLTSMAPGDTLKMRWPFGWVYAQDETTPIVMIAGWIWITPFRAMMLEAKDAQKELTLIYSSKDWYLFQQELDSIADSNPNINIIYVADRTALRAELENLIWKYNNSAHYFSSGTPKMIRSTKEILQQKWIQWKNIFNDSFNGY